MVTEVQQAVESAGVLGTFGVNWKLFLAQLINFGLILGVLWKFAYKPLLKIMDERSSKIEKGLQDATDAAKARGMAEEERASIVAEARKSAKEIMDAATALAEKERTEATARTKAEVQKIVDAGREQIKSEQSKMMADAKSEVGMLVAMAAEKVLKDKIDAKTDAGLIAEAIKAVEKAS